MEHFNEIIFQFINNPGWHNIFFDTLAILASKYLLWLLLPVAIVVPFLFFVFKKDPTKKWYALRVGFVYALTLLFTATIVEFVKGFVGMPRPFELLTNVQVLLPFGGGDSFPSMHTALAFAVAGATFFWSRRLGGTLLIVATVIGLSRIYVGVHFPLDVIAGALIGLGVAYIFRYFLTHILRNNTVAKGALSR